jgi:hypothetical protein
MIMSSASIEPERLASPADLVRKDLRIHGHSQLLYWWPVWLAGFLAAAWTWADNRQMILVPEQTQVANNQLVLPANGSIHATLVHVTRSPIPGAVFATVLLAVVIFSHASLRGIWALFAAASLLALVFLLSWMEWWQEIVSWLRGLRVYMNLAAYLVFAVPIFLVWFAAVFIFDRRIYLAFSLGQFRVRDELGDQEKSFDAGGIMFEKRPYDWFRWLIGFGAGDLIIRTGGPSPQVFELPNVIGIGRWMGELEQRLRTRDVE